MKWYLLWTVVAVAALSTGCGSEKSTGDNDSTARNVSDEVSETSESSSDLANMRWILVELGGQPVVVPPDQLKPYIRFDVEGGKIEGFGWCNRMFGGFEVDGDALRIGPLASTRMACANGMGDETKFFEALDSTTRFRIDGETLELHGGEGLLARFAQNDQ